MTVTGTSRDTDARTMTIAAEFAAPPARVWRLWEDPRLIEQWWGPPTWPATFLEHDIRPGGGTRYFMTGPDGATSRGWWRTVAADPPHGLEFENGFADETGEPDPTRSPMVIRVAVEERSEGGSRMTAVIRFASDEEMDQVMTMGMEEGMTAAMGQMDGLL
jgi:uncharacterized protein YndB with AHSA1/START domain